MKIFISQGMAGKTDEEILAEREYVIKILKDKYGEDIEIIDSFIKEAPENAAPLWYVGKSLEYLSTADLVYFCKKWQDYRGCRFEHRAAIEYGIPVVVGDFDPHKTVIGKRMDVELLD